MPYTTALDIQKLNADTSGLGILEEGVRSHPEFRYAAARIIEGIEYMTTIRTGRPAVGFRNVNEGIDASKSTFENRSVKCYLSSGRVEADKALADAYVDGAAAYQAIEAVGLGDSLLGESGRQFYYGTENDRKGFPGLAASYDDMKTVDAGATSAKSSAWLVKFGERHTQFVFGQGTPLSLSPFRIGDAVDSKGRKFPAYIADLCSWIGLQVVNKDSVARVANLGATDANGLTDDLLYSALEKMPAAIQPDVIFVSRRSLGQLRRSRKTALNPTPDLPTTCAGIPVVATDSISNSETV